MKIINTEELMRFTCVHGDVYITLTSLEVISLSQLKEREDYNKKVYEIIESAKKEYEKIKKEVKKSARPFGLPWWIVVVIIIVNFCLNVPILITVTDEVVKSSGIPEWIWTSRLLIGIYTPVLIFAWVMSCDDFLPKKCAKRLLKLFPQYRILLPEYDLQRLLGDSYERAIEIKYRYDQKTYSLCKNI